MRISSWSLPTPTTKASRKPARTFIANDFRVTRALDSLLISAKAIKGDPVIAEDIATRVHALRHLLKQVGHNV